jgi:AcrR family transcriptional regulator
MTTNEESGAPKGGRPRSIQAQQAIFDATLSLLATEGLEAMSVEAIAAKAGVGKQTIYRWWPSKEALVIDAIKSFQQMQNPVIDSGSFREDCLAMFRNVLQSWNGPYARGLALNMLGVMMAHPHVYQAFYDQTIAPRFQQLAQMIRRAQERREVRQELDASEIIGLLAGPFWYHLLLDTRGIPLAPDLAEQLVDAVLHGIAERGKSEAGNAVSHNAREL